MFFYSVFLTVLYIHLNIFISWPYLLNTLNMCHQHVHADFVQKGVTLEMLHCMTEFVLFFLHRFYMSSSTDQSALIWKSCIGLKDIAWTWISHEGL